MGNSVSNLSLIKLTKKSAEEVKLKGMDDKRTVIPELNLKELNLSDNNFECFPWVAIYSMKELEIINLGRNRIKKLLDDSEKRQAKKILSENNREPKPLFDCFSKKLRILDLSSNMLREFPKELNVLNLEELNLMNN